MKSKFTFLLLFMYIFITSQVITGKIISNDNNQPIPFARIGVMNENFGAIADENGIYKIDLSNTDKNKELSVQIGGYESFTKKIKDFTLLGNYDIILKERISEITEVKLTAKTFENKNLGVKSKAKNMLYGFSSNGSNQSAYKEFAIPFSNSKRLKIQKHIL